MGIMGYYSRVNNIRQDDHDHHPCQWNTLTTMEIQTIRTTFSQFSKDLWIRVSDGNVTLEVEIEHKELRAFAAMLVDVADDALSKIGEDAQACQSKLLDCLKDLRSSNWPTPTREENLD